MNAKAVEALYANVPVSFLPASGRNSFLAQGTGYSMEIKSDRALLTILDSNRRRSTPLEMRFTGSSNPAPTMHALNALPTTFHYFAGTDPKNWRTCVTQYARIQSDNIYPGVDVVWYGNQRQLEYDIVIRPGADPKRIRLQIGGARQLSIDPRGDLILATDVKTLIQRRPRIYQVRDGHEREIGGAYVLYGHNRVGFHLGAYDHSLPLIVDPLLSYSTYLGGNSDDMPVRVAVDQQGNAYITGWTSSTNFAGVQPKSGFQIAAFVAKMQPSASGPASLIFVTYLIGGYIDQAYGVAVDASNNVYITGGTYSGSFPVTSTAFQKVLSSNEAAFLTKLNADGTIQYSTLIQGENEVDISEARGIALDSAGNAYIAGFTANPNFPTTAGAYSRVMSGFRDAFALKFNTALPGSAGLLYSSFLGGSGYNAAKSIAVDASGNLYLTGVTDSVNFPTTSTAFQPASGGNEDVFVTKINPNFPGSGSLVYSTYVGGISDDEAKDIAVDGLGFAYITGWTKSVNFPATSSAYQTTKPVSYPAAFLTKIDTRASKTASLAYSTFLGGSSSEVGYGVAVDAAQTAWVVGETSSGDFPVTPDAYRKRSAFISDYDAFLVALNTTASGVSSLGYGTYFGGTDNEHAFGVALDKSGNIYFVGITDGQLLSTNLPTTAGAFQSRAQGFNDGFVAKFSAAAPVACTATVPNAPTVSPIGTAVLVGDFVMTCTGGSAGTTVTANFQLFLNTNVASISQPSLLIDNGSLGTISGLISSVNSVTFSNVSFPAPGTGQRVLKITGIRADASLLGSSSTGLPTPIVMLAQSSSSAVAIANPQLTVAYIAPVAVQNVVTTNQTPSSNCAVPASVTTFTDKDPQVYIWFLVANANPGDTPRVDWSTPSGSIYRSFTWSPATTSGSRCFWDSLSIAGTAVASQPGVWSAAIYWNGGSIPIIVQTFTITGPPAPPFGSFDVPNSTTGLTNLAGAFAVGGWALSTMTVANVGIWRDPIGTEPTGANGLVFLVNATMIAGSRPDIAAAFPTYPHNNYGWGAQILTTGLPGTNGLPRGNGTYRLHAIATDQQGLSKKIGTPVTVSVNNTASLLPFGTIDTPGQGGLAFGSAYVNFGWVLTPQPNIIPFDGSTITVYIDNVPVGHPIYNFTRCDVDFQGLRNSGSTDCSKNGTSPGPVGFFNIDTTKLTNGLHTISWGVSDSGNHTNGIGSRFFIVQN